jgi:hypothetical protein
MINSTLKRSVSRPKQQLPVEIIDDLMGSIRNGFYPGDERWFADQEFIRRRVVTWPAAWLNSRGVTLKPERYKELLLGIIIEIKRCGKTEAVKYWPGYLAHCVQQHFKHHGEEIYEEAKAVRNQVETALMACHKAADAARGTDSVAGLALVHYALTSAHKRKRRPGGKQQLSLL